MLRYFHISLEYMYFIHRTAPNIQEKQKNFPKTQKPMRKNRKYRIMKEGKKGVDISH